MRWDTDLPAELAARLWAAPDLLLTESETLQHKPRCQVVKVTDRAGEFVLKKHNWGGLVRTLKKALRRAPALQCWLDGRWLADAGVPTPRPRACLQRGFGPIGTRSYLLTDFVAGTTLYRFLRFTNPGSETVQWLAVQVAAIWQMLDDLHATHNDLKTENFQIDHQNGVWLIDLEKMLRHKRSQNIRQRQAIDLKRFFHPRNWRTNPATAEVFRQAIMATRAGAALAGSLAHSGHPLVVPRPTKNRPSELVTVLIQSRNTAHAIGRCLESVADIADEILIADACMADQTGSLVGEQMNRLDATSERFRTIQHDSSDECESLNNALERAINPWILHLLPDELVSPDLAKEIQDLLTNEPHVDAFQIMPRRYRTGDFHHVDHSAMHPRVRLFRRSVSRFELRQGQLSLALRSDNIGRLRSHLLFAGLPHGHRTADPLTQRVAA